MVGWHHRLNGPGFGWTLGVRDGQRGLACCSSRGHKESDMTEQMNWKTNFKKEVQNAHFLNAITSSLLYPKPDTNITTVTYSIQMMDLHYGLYAYLFNIVLKDLVVGRSFKKNNNEHVIFPQELLEPLEDKAASSATRNYWGLTATWSVIVFWEGLLLVFWALSPQ